MTGKKIEDIADMGTHTRHDAAAGAARKKAEAASDRELIKMLRVYADDVEHDGRAHAPQWMREAANRLQMKLNAMSASQ